MSSFIHSFLAFMAGFGFCSYLNRRRAKKFVAEIIEARTLSKKETMAFTHMMEREREKFWPEKGEV